MGLSIIVEKPIKLTQNPDEVEDFTVVDESPELNIFKDFFFERNNGYYDVNAGIRNAGYKEDELQWRSIGATEDHTGMEFKFIDRNGKYVSIVNPPIIYKIEKCIITQEVGYQGKGANKLFMSDDAWNGPFIVDMKTLLEHWEKYFSDDEERKTNFKKNIVDKFVEGENFVRYC